MPNWCKNVLRIEADRQVLVQIRDLLHGEGPFDFNRVVPEPEWTEQEVKEDAWYGWRRKNWGTKWNTNPERVDVADLSDLSPAPCLEYRFDTAWSPPIPVVQQLAERWPEAVFTLAYYEDGADYAGVEIWSEENGAVTHSPVRGTVNGMRRLLELYFDMDWREEDEESVEDGQKEE